MLKGKWVFWGIVWWLWLNPPVQSGIVDSPHNLSAMTGRSSNKEICIFCHVTHTTHPSEPLWSHDVEPRNYVPYSSSTLHTRPGVPNGSSKLCLSCHDGTIASGRFEGALFNLSGHSNGNLGLDLSDDHPVSFSYEKALNTGSSKDLKPPVIHTHVRLDENGYVQCTSCHDPHDNRYGSFLVMRNYQGALCLECHRIQRWEQSAHRLSNARWNQVPPDPWPESALGTVSANACENCHDVHQATRGEWLLRKSSDNELCLGCHNGHVASADIQASFNKISAHPLQRVHCTDCHDPHTASPSDRSSIVVSRKGTSGLSSRGIPLETAGYEYEICFKCHGDSSMYKSPDIHRDITQMNVRLEFALDNPSFHPIEGPGKNHDVPSLIEPLRESSIIQCTDCHADDDPMKKAPHGSRFEPILARRYETSDGLMETPEVYRLCYHCHNRDIILSQNSGFPLHRRHVADVRTSCATCHDPHGISADQGSKQHHAHLINFNLSVVGGTGPETPVYRSTGYRSGSCTLVCHRVVHRNNRYGLLIQGRYRGNVRH